MRESNRRTVFVRSARRGSPSSSAAALAALVVLGGCQSVPDALNPVEWYRSTVDLFTGGKGKDERAQKPRPGQQEAQVRADRGQPPPGADKPFPSLASVPERPPAATEGRIAEGLVADPERPRYAPAIRRQAEAPPPQPGAVALAPSPPAAPVLPVTPAPAAPRLAAAPPAVAVTPSPPVMAAPPGAPPATGRMDESVRARLMAGLESGAAAAGLPPADALAPGPAELPGTVVISSAGVETATSEAVRTFVFPAQRPQAAAPGTAFAPAPVARPAAPPPAGVGVRVATILFANGASSLTEKDRRILSQVVQLQRQHGGKLRVVGHASQRTRNMDPAQHAQVNYDVSAQRADAIARELLKLGAKRESLATFALADSRPVFYEVMPSGEAGNRRVEIFLEG